MGGFLDFYQQRPKARRQNETSFKDLCLLLPFERLGPSRFFVLGLFLWCREGESNPHGVATAGF
jgi:hypothetical protein